MLSTRAVRGWRQMWANQGAAATLKTAADRLRNKLRKSAPTSSEELDMAELSRVHPFDLEHHVDTSGLIWGEHLASGHRSDAWNTAYYGIAPSVFHAAMRALPIDFANFTFCDVGSGKGRGVMLAAGYPFRAVLGVEISPELHAVALSNVQIYRARRSDLAPIELIRMDAVEFTLPVGPLVLFFYHPFCKPVLQRVLRNVGQSLQQHPREVYVVYINPETRGVLDQSPFLERVYEASLVMAEGDQLADRMGSSVEECAIYRSRS